MKLSASNIAWAPEERIEAYGVLHRHGFTGLEIAPGLFFHAADDPFMPDGASAARAFGEMQDAGLSLVSMQSLLFGVEGAALFGDLEARAAFERGMVRAIELAGRFGIPNCVFGSPGQRRVPEGMETERALDKAAQVFAGLGDVAKREGTTITIEANPAAYGTNFLTNLDDALAFVARVDHPAIAAILDLGAMHMNGEFDTVPARIPAIIPRLNHVHVSEPQLAPAPARATDLRATLNALGHGGYAKAVSIEMKRPEGGIGEVEAAAERLADAMAQRESADA